MSNVALTPDEQQYLQISALTQPLQPGTVAHIDLTFQLAQGDQLDTGLFDIPVDVPEGPLPRNSVTPGQS